jgi:hypothetical protein
MAGSVSATDVRERMRLEVGAAFRNVSLWATLLAAGLLLTNPAEADILQSDIDPVLVCGSRPKGTGIYNGRFRVEYIGDLVDVRKPDTPKDQAPVLELRQRHARLKNTDCYITFYTVTGAESFSPGLRATVSFAEAARWYVDTGPRKRMVGFVDVTNLLFQLSPKVNECVKTFVRAKAAAIEKHGDIGVQIDEYLIDETDTLNSCEETEIARLDKLGFLGVYVASNGHEKVFTVLDGKLQFWEKGWSPEMALMEIDIIL